ncbi:sensor histidine kinase [Mongoliitalea daihaiensis]|uniref:sensor histidine kinase n=1 Tax=Mongoliitalea daihaiensis TaxID=2782006 RepID=UPI001F1DBB27|nr:sensor histidine kinase [Mongoliitalea daihaiensis]UJP64339.1 hypothetical protein IPZ59_16225 [Mongoliitalea daihaiensis]
MFLRIFKWVGIGVVFFACDRFTVSEQSASTSLIVGERTHMLSPTITHLKDLQDSLQPQIILLADMPAFKHLAIPSTEQESYTFEDGYEVVRLKPPQIISRSFLKNDQGDAILDKNGNPYFLGDGGLSHFTTFTTDDGLALDNITSSVLDSNGYLWFGTWGGGISKFDGMSFTNYNTNHGLANNLVHCIAEDLSGSIWIGTDGGGVSKFDGLTFTTYSVKDGLADNLVYGITPDSKGNIWIATGEGGASKFDGNAFVNYTIDDSLPSNSIIKIAEDDKGHIWFATGNAGVSRFDGSSFTQFTVADGLIDNEVNCIMADSSGKLWFGTRGGGVSVYHEDGNSEKGVFTNYTKADGLGSNEIWQIIEDRESIIWFATGGGGISKFDGKSFTNFTSSEGLPMSLVYSITEDRSGNLWIGTGGGGVALFYGSAFSNFTVYQGLPENGVYSIIEDNQGNYWLGTNGGGISKFDGKSFTNFSTEQGLANPLVISSLKDSKGNLWFGTGGGGISVYKDAFMQNQAASFTTINSKNGLPNDIIYSLLEDSRGNIWVGTGGGGLVKFDRSIPITGNDSFTIYTTSQGLPHNTVLGLLEDRNGAIWIGTAGGGISKFDGESFTNYTTDQGLANDIVWSILEDSFGQLWFATQGGGVSRFDGIAFSTFSTREGLNDDTTYDLVADLAGNIFIGTNRGLTVIPAEASQVPFNQLKQKLEYYSTAYGYPVKDVNKGMLLDSKGILWAGNGSDKTALVRFDYSQLEKKKSKPIVKITSISLSEENISWSSLIPLESTSIASEISKVYSSSELKTYGKVLSDEERAKLQKRLKAIAFSGVSTYENIPENLSLPYSSNSITIDFTTDELARPNLIEYSYILEGYSKDWISPVKSNRAIFGNMREGNYQFKVKARYTGPSEQGFNDWSEISSYAFSVRPPWHRSWWAFSIYGLLLIFILRRIHVYQKAKTIRRERDRAQQRELEQAKKIEQAYKELKTTQAQLIHAEKMASLGALTAGIAHEIKNPLNFVKNFSEVSIELIDEIFTEYNNPSVNPKDESIILENLEDIKFNLGKVHHHGSRANSIVSSMLQHARGGTGQKEPTNLNALIKDYTTLSFHGMRAGKNPINVDIRYELDDSIGEVSLIAEDFSRVIVNLCNNAFDAMRHKILTGDQDFQPTLYVRSRFDQGKVVIEVEDNGPGMSDDIRKKILHPFFTTKKGTEGTGLGLSISNDIVIAHGGILHIESILGKGSKFTITLNELNH